MKRIIKNFNITNQTNIFTVDIDTMYYDRYVSVYGFPLDVA